MIKKVNINGSEEELIGEILYIFKILEDKVNITTKDLLKLYYDKDIKTYLNNLYHC